MVKVLKRNFWLILILGLALWLRTYRLDYLELFGDELDAGYQSYSLMVSGKDYKGNWLPSYMHSYSEWRAPGLMYGMVPYIKIFGLNEVGVRMGPAVFGVISILFFYLLLVEAGFSKKVGIVSSLFLAISPWHIQYSRAGFEITLMSALLLGGLWSLMIWLRSRKVGWLVASAVLLSASIYTYNTAVILVPMMTLAILYIYGAKMRQTLTLLGWGLLLCGPIIFSILFGHTADRFGTLTLFQNKDITAKIISYRNAANSNLLSKIFFNKVIVPGKAILFNYSNAFSSKFLFEEGDVTFRHSLHQVGNLYWIELPLIIIGLVALIRINEKKVKVRLILSLLLISPMASSLTIDGYNHATRLFLLVFPLSAIAAFGFVSIKSWVKVMVVAALIFEFSFFQYYYWTFYRTESWRWWHTGYKSAMLYIKENKSKYNEVLIDNTYEPSLIRYLFWNKIDPKQVLGLVDKDKFCIEKVCFVDFGDKFKFDEVSQGTMYLISQTRNVGGDWDLEKSPPEKLKVLKTVRNYDDFPIFYLVTKNEQK